MGGEQDDGGNVENMKMKEMMEYNILDKINNRFVKERIVSGEVDIVDMILHKTKVLQMMYQID